MFIKKMLREKVKTTATSSILFIVCIALLACQNLANAQDSEVRTELLRLLELQLSVAESLGRTDLTAPLERAIEDVHFANEADLELFSGSISEMRNHGDSLQRLDRSIQRAYEEGEARSRKMSSLTSTADDPNDPGIDLTDPPYFDGGITGIHCPWQQTGTRNNTEIIIDAKIALSTAKVLWSGMEVVCGLDLTAIVSVGVVSGICITAAAGVGTAEAFLEGFLMCDTTVDEAHLDAAFMRAKDNFDLGTHIHDDLKAHDKLLNDKLEQHDTDIKALLSEISENQREIIKLLKTPQGKRPGWNKEGY